MHRIISAILLLFAYLGVVAANDSTIVILQFKQGWSRIDTASTTNHAGITILDSLFTTLSDSTNATISHIDIVGWASPEGRLKNNIRLSNSRATAARNFLVTRYGIPADSISATGSGEAWSLLGHSIAGDHYPDSAAVMEIIDDAPAPGKADLRKNRLIALKGGRVWSDVYRRYFPALRQAAITVTYSYPEPPVITEDTIAAEPEPAEPSESSECSESSEYSEYSDNSEASETPDQEEQPAPELPDSPI